MANPDKPQTSIPDSLPEWKRQLPMWLTFSRMAVCPFFVILLRQSDPLWAWVAAGLFMAASATDYFDGYFARKYNAISNLGKFMDPIADKILVASVLIMLIPSGKVDALLVLLLLVRDILIGGLRSIAAADQVIIDAKAAGKWKTAVQMLSIPAVLVGRDSPLPEIYWFGVGLLWMSVCLSLISGYQYVSLYRASRSRK